MSKSLKPLFSFSLQSFAYGIGFFGRQVVIYFALPLITRLVSKDDFGVISIVTSFYTVINTLTNFGLPSATFRFYNDQIGESEKKEILGTSQALFFLLALILSGLMSLFSQQVSTYLLGSPQYAPIILIVAVLLVIETMNYFGTVLLRLHVRPGAVSLHSIVAGVGQLGLAIVFIRNLGLGVYGYWVGFLIGSIISLLLMIWLNRKQITFRFTGRAARELLKYGIPLIPANLAISFIQLTDRFFLRTYLDLEVVAVYAIGYKIGSIVNLVLAPVRIAWPNFAFSSIVDPDAKRTYRDLLTFIILICTFVSLGIFIFRSPLISIISPEPYQAATIVVPWISAAMILYGIYPVVSLGPRILKKTKPLAWIAVITVFVNILLLLILVPLLGMLGAAISVLGSYVFLVVFNYLISQRMYRFSLDFRRIIIILLIALAEAFLVEFTKGYIDKASYQYLYQGLIFISYPVLLILFKVLPVKEIINFSYSWFTKSVQDD